MNISPDLREYLEWEHLEFESQRFKEMPFWRVPVYALKDTPVYSVFERFSNLFPDHPSDVMDAYYLFSSPHRGESSILFRCSHFEHTSSEDLPLLAEFIESSALILTKNRFGHVELLDGNSGRLHILYHSALDHVAAILKRRASRIVS